MALIVEDGVSKIRIVVAEGCAPVELHAAKELQRYIRQISGATLRISSKSSLRGPNICIGKAAAQVASGQGKPDWGSDGYVVQTAGNDLILCGAQPYSSLYAVYHLLEKHLGCGFFEDGDQVPTSRTIAVGQLNDVEKPRVEWRINFSCMQDAYSSMRWWGWKEFKHWVDWMAKKRLNRWYTERIAEYAGIVPAAATKMGVPIQPTAWQKERARVLRRTFDYARSLGIKTIFNAATHVSCTFGVPGVNAYQDAPQLREFARRFPQETGRPISLIPYGWGGREFPILDPRDKATVDFIAASVRAYEEIFGTDHIYALCTPQEGGLAKGDAKEKDDITYNLVMAAVNAVRQADPQALVMTTEPYAYGDVYQAMKRARQDSKTIIFGDMSLNSAGRLHGYVMHDYYWGLQWTTGFFTGAGRHTNPNWDVELAVENAKRVASDPRTENLLGFTTFGEMNHRYIFPNDLFCALCWNPAAVDLDTFTAEFARRRYGPECAERSAEVWRLFASSVHTADNMDATNGSMYRHMTSNYLPGLTRVSVKRTISYLPKMRRALEILLSEREKLEKSPLYRFDVVDYGRTYLAAVFNDRFARCRAAMRAGDKDSFERYAKSALETMDFMARFCSADPQFRLKTHDDLAAKWPQIVPGHRNSESNWYTFTTLMFAPPVDYIYTDYVSEDFTELIAHYFRPRMERYINAMREFVNAGKDISGRLTYPDSAETGWKDTTIPNRVSDWATPRGNCPWSPYGPMREPELAKGDEALMNKIVTAGTVSGKYDFYEGPIGPLLAELLESYPVPGDLGKILTEEDVETGPTLAHDLGVAMGETVMGFITPDIVEQAKVPAELGYLIDVDKMSSEYNIARGTIASYKVNVSSYLKLMRVADTKSPLGDHLAPTFEFAVQNKRYVLQYDPGTDHSIAGFYVEEKTLSSPPAF